VADILQAALTAAVREQMEKLMRTGKYEYQSDFAKKYFAQGLAEAIVLVLRSRGLEPDAAAQHRIEAERDEDRLKLWLQRAMTAGRVDEIFAEE
jgi:hypothetical protein